MDNYTEFLLDKYQEVSKKLKELIKDERVKEYIHIITVMKAVNLMLVEEMTKCNHIFVKTKENSDTSIYHCLKCGLTNNYELKNTSLDELQKSMKEIYEKTFLNGTIIYDEECNLHTAKKLYDMIVSCNENIAIDVLIEKFKLLYTSDIVINNKEDKVLKK